jgi:hypothetical protein
MNRRRAKSAKFLRRHRPRGEAKDAEFAPDMINP